MNRQQAANKILFLADILRMIFLWDLVNYLLNQLCFDESQFNWINNLLNKSEKIALHDKLCLLRILVSMAHPK